MFGSNMYIAPPPDDCVSGSELQYNAFWAPFAKDVVQIMLYVIQQYGMLFPIVLMCFADLCDSD